MHLLAKQLMHKCMYCKHMQHQLFLWYVFPHPTDMISVQCMLMLTVSLCTCWLQSLRTKVCIVEAFKLTSLLLSCLE